MQVGTTRRGLDQGIIYSGGLGNSTVQRKGKGNGVGKGKKDSQGGSKGMGDQSQHHRNVSSSSSSSSSATTSTSAAAAATAAEMEGLRTRVTHPSGSTIYNPTFLMTMHYPYPLSNCNTIVTNNCNYCLIELQHDRRSYNIIPSSPTTSTTVGTRSIQTTARKTN